MRTYSVSIVNYLNSAPFVTGLRLPEAPPMTLYLDHPADSAGKLLRGEVDLALAPVAIIPQMEEYHIVPGYCIGTEGEVRTVRLFSDVPLERIRRIYLDYQSQTSVQLVSLLCRHHWDIAPELMPARPGFRKDITGADAGLVIGDRTIDMLGRFPYEFDLGAAWRAWTGMPFVFAVWLSKQQPEEVWLRQFNNSLAAGLALRKSVSAHYAHLDTDHFSVEDYLFHRISYQLDTAKKAALQRFLDLMGR